MVLTPHITGFAMVHRPTAMSLRAFDISLFYCSVPTNEHHLKLTDATWDERFSVICLILAVAALGLAPFWVSDMIRTGVHPVIEHLQQAGSLLNSHSNPFL